MSKRKSKARPRFTPAGAPRRGQPWPSRHEQSVLRRAALGFVLVTQREDQPPLFTYEDGSAIRNELGHELDPDDFKRLAQWLDPEPDDSLFGAPPQRWNARKP
jgi:hypothetical protein